MKEGTSSEGASSLVALRQYRKMVAKEREYIRRALEVYHIKWRMGSMPGRDVRGRRLRAFVENYKNIHAGKRTGAVFNSVDEVLKRCVPHFRNKCRRAQAKAFGAGESSSHAASGLKMTRLIVWCECYRQFGKWPSLPCHRDNQEAWDANSILSSMPVKTTVNSFKNYKQTVRKNGSGTVANTHMNAMLSSMDPDIFTRGYNKKKAREAYTSITFVPPCIRQLPDLTRYTPEAAPVKEATPARCAADI